MDSLYIRPETCHFFDCKRGNTAKRAFPTGVSGCGDSGDRVDEQNGHAIGCVDADVFARSISNHGVGFDRWRCFVGGDNSYAVDLPERFQLRRVDAKRLEQGSPTVVDVCRVVAHVWATIKR